MSSVHHHLPQYAAHLTNDPGRAPVGGDDAPQLAWPDDGSLTGASVRSSAIVGFLAGFAGLLAGVACSLLPVTALSFSGRAVLFGGVGLLVGAAIGVVLGARGDHEADVSSPVR